jgi:2-desacetyl-2-hydroxyethyl bacteriochlorophyllide A dehydrogenase
MKAARFYKVGQPLVVEEVPLPRPAREEVLLRVKACGLCSSDIHIAYEGITPTAFQPIILGHEISGEITELGEDVEGWEVGDRVVVCAILSCGQCTNCISGNQQICLQRRIIGIHENGGLAEYVSVSAKNLARLPDKIPYDQGAILTDAVATPYHAITSRGRLTPGESVVVIGCGGLGIHAVQLAKVFGADTIIAVDVLSVALERAQSLGADLVCSADQEDHVDVIKKATKGLGVDLALECVGQQGTIATAVACLRAGGRAVVVGLGADNINTLPPTEFVRREIELRGSYGFTVREIEELIQLVDRGELDISGSISRTIALDEINQGLEALDQKIDNPVRIVVGMGS